MAFGTIIALLLAVASPAQAGQQAPAQPQGKGQIIPLPNVGGSPSQQLYQNTLEHALIQMEYESTSRESAMTRTMDEFCYMTKSMPDGSTRTLLVALELYASQHNKIFLWGESEAKDGSVGPNPDLAALAKHLQQTQQSAQKVTRKFSPRELELDFYQLSFATPGQALDLLQALGFNTGKPGQQLTLDQLPLAWHIADSPRAQVATGREGDVEPLPAATEVGPRNRLALLYHRTQGKDVMHLREVLDQKIDIPARQVLIESIVLETTEEGRKELGIEWDWEERVGEVYAHRKAGRTDPGEQSRGPVQPVGADREQHAGRHTRRPKSARDPLADHRTEFCAAGGRGIREGGHYPQHQAAGVAGQQHRRAADPNRGQ
jgi:hypothetical protein